MFLDPLVSSKGFKKFYKQENLINFEECSVKSCLDLADVRPKEIYFVKCCYSDGVNLWVSLCGLSIVNENQNDRVIQLASQIKPL